MERNELVQEVARLQAAGRRVVFTNGCFDILHAGHVRYLNAARAAGDVLVLGLNSDASVRRLKGESRPINGEEDRAEVGAAEVLPALGVLDAREAGEELAQHGTRSTSAGSSWYWPRSILNSAVDRLTMPRMV